MKVLVCGDRNWEDYDTLARVLDSLDATTFLIEGGARGADTMALEYALWRGWDWEEYPAQWNRYGLGAGHIRNKEMLDQSPDLVIAFHNDLARSKGTKHMVKIAKQAKVPVIHGTSGLTWESQIIKKVRQSPRKERREAMAKELILDLRSIDPKDCTDIWADCSARSNLENAVLDFAGKVVRVRITVVKEVQDVAT